MTIETVRPERTSAVAANELIDLPNVVWLEHDDRGRRARIESTPYLRRVVGRSERVENEYLASRFHAGRCDHWLPAVIGLPVRVLDPPEPEARRDISQLCVHRW